LAKHHLVIELRAWRQRFYPETSIWEPVPDAVKIPNDDHLMRNIRYVHLNPCRAGLVKDPLGWEWSTHLDVTDCILHPWPEKKTLALLFKCSEKQLAQKMHSYISSDPTVAVAGSASVKNYKSGDLVRTDTPSILWASALALREDLRITRGPVRTLAIQVARFLGQSIKYQDLGMSKSGLNRALRHEVSYPDVLPVLKILSDPRFTNHGRVERTLRGLQHGHNGVRHP
jgi:hypothetical protein